MTISSIVSTLIWLRDSLGIDTIALVMEMVEVKYDEACKADKYGLANALSQLHERLQSYAPPPTEVSGQGGEVRSLPQLDVPYEPVWMSERLRNRLGFVKSGLRHDVEQQYEKGWVPVVVWKIDSVIEGAINALESEE
jgi:hypothetical protein